MPLTYVHYGLNCVVYYALSFVFSVNFHFGVSGCLVLLMAELIDLDHLFSRPVYHPRRNPFKVHFLHKNWKWVLFVALMMLFYYPFSILGLGLILHLIEDYVYTKYYLGI